MFFVENYKICKMLLFLSVLYTGIAQAKNVKSIEVEEKPIVVIVSSHNNQEWIEANLESLATQMYTNYKVIYVDDASTDQTVSMVKKYTQEHDCEDKISLVENKESIGWVGCVHQALMYCPDDVIIIPILGSDWFSRGTALSEINQAYKNEYVWVTYGQYTKYPTNSFGNASVYSQEVVQHRSFRQAQWTVGKPLTSYSWLYKKVAESDLKKDGAYISAEQAFAYPLLEMAGNRIKYMQSSLYVQNTKKNMSNGSWENVHQDVITWLKNKQMYDRISDFPFNENQNVMKVLYSLDSGKNKEKKGAHTIDQGADFSLLVGSSKKDVGIKKNNTSVGGNNKIIEVREKPIVVVVPSYNNSEWYAVNLASIFNQMYTNYRVVYVDDCSTDGTGELVEQYVKKHHYEDKITIIKNEYNKKALENLNTVIRSCSDESIIVILDGDDWFSRNDVLHEINEAYRDENIWLTYGNFLNWPSNLVSYGANIPDVIIKNKSYRFYKWVTGAPRTFYAWLFKQIKEDDLKYKGCFFSSSSDVAIMYPLLEMVDGKFKFISNIAYTRNVVTDLNDFKLYKKDQLNYGSIIKKQQSYEPIKKLPFEYNKNSINVRYTIERVHGAQTVWSICILD